MLNMYCSNTQNRACHQEFPLTLPLPTDPLRSHLSSPFTDFMLQRGAPSLRHSPKKSSSISLESWLLIRELHFRCRRLFFPLLLVRILVFSPLLFFIISFFILYWFHLLSHCLLVLCSTRGLL